MSVQRNIGRRLLRNKGAVFGLIVIAAALLVALTAYFIAPDASPNANRMIVEVGGRKPGFRQQFLLLKKDRTAGSSSFFQRLLSGKEDNYNWIPIDSYSIQGDSLIVQKFVDEGVEERRSYPASLQKIETHTFLLGTDKYGRDILSRLLVGVRVSLAVGLVTVIISLTIGVLLGALAGYFRGRTDDAILWLINIIWSIPTLLLVFAITLMLGKGFWQVFIAIGLTLWVNVARIIRGQVLAVREREFVEAARALGYSHSFLGVGVQPPQPSWGLMIKENYNFIITHNPMLALAPGLAIMLLVLAFNLLGNGLRDALDVRT
jgi:peptide/nickel transport system permease protein